jgi:phage gp36-like protein
VTFASVDDLRVRYGDQELMLLADRDGDGVLDAGVVEAHLRDADAEIISELAGAVTIDPAEPPLNLKRLACLVARYRLYGANPPEAVRQDYEDALDFLRLVRDGKASLDGGAAAPVEIPQSPRAAAVVPGSRIFRRGL